MFALRPLWISYTKYISICQRIGDEEVVEIPASSAVPILGLYMMLALLFLLIVSPNH